MPATLPTTKHEILATGTMAEEFADAWNTYPQPPIPNDINILKKIVQGGLPMMQAKYASTRPATITETEHNITLSNNYTSRVIVCHLTTPEDKPSPLIVLFHGGGHCIAFPEIELDVARALAAAHNATVVLPTVRLAPEDPFPATVKDGWAVVQYLAAEFTTPHDPSNPLFPPQTDLSKGFIVGGTSSGSNLAGAVAPLARDNNLTPPLTGQYLCCGGYIDFTRVPEKYTHLYLSFEQNKTSPILSRDFLLMFRGALKPNPDSPLWAPMLQHHPNDAPGEVKEGLKALPPAYFQACGMDLTRDDSLIYEKVLREECGIATRLDLYSGYPHCWWSNFPELEMSKKRLQDTVDGLGWLLEQSK
ncbi:hypothetical protein HK097_006311 [Rhizophlyctis rosea]|uniref:Alpha/beta hydrolase fold-3 domain-containing protein n=1 Tax=Rhizophlyctis rosea TaxID=64517 RepID=A0AAD5SKP9_9FUNG|nr:hypothetical protein HK097_006311 [Rhizophlyctis rosea]